MISILFLEIVLKKTKCRKQITRYKSNVLVKKLLKNNLNRLFEDINYFLLFFFQKKIMVDTQKPLYIGVFRHKYKQNYIMWYSTGII